MDEKELREAAEREEDEAACLKMLAAADEGKPETAALASKDRAVAIELEMEAEHLRAKAAERKP